MLPRDIYWLLAHFDPRGVIATLRSCTRLWALLDWTLLKHIVKQCTNAGTRRMHLARYPNIVDGRNIPRILATDIRGFGVTDSLVSYHNERELKLLRKNDVILQWTANSRIYGHHLTESHMAILMGYNIVLVQHTPGFRVHYFNTRISFVHFITPSCIIIKPMMERGFVFDETGQFVLDHPFGFAVFKHFASNNKGLWACVYKPDVVVIWNRQHFVAQYQSTFRVLQLTFFESFLHVRGRKESVILDVATGLPVQDVQPPKQQRIRHMFINTLPRLGPEHKIYCRVGTKLIEYEA